MRYEYSGYEGDMILRDHLAYDRTKFALLRTFLAIARTALGLLASGAGLIILQKSITLIAIGYVLLGGRRIIKKTSLIYGIRAKRRLDGLKPPQDR